MAKSSGFFTVRNGSTKSHTYAVYGGKQITKSRMGKMTNPSTESQILSRIVAKSCMTSWHVLEPFSYNMFQNIPYGNKTKDRFLAVNSYIQKRDMYLDKDASNFATYEDSGKPHAMPSHFRISEGSLMPLSNKLYNVGENWKIGVDGDFTWENWRRILGVKEDAILSYVVMHMSYGLMFTRWFIPKYLSGNMQMNTQLKMQQYGVIKWFPYIDLKGHTINWIYADSSGNYFDAYSFSGRGYVISERRRGKWHHSTCELTLDPDARDACTYKRALEEWPKTVKNTYTDDTIWVVPMK